MQVVREQHKLSTRETTRLLGLARAKQYRSKLDSHDKNKLVLQAIEQVISEFNGYGYRRVTKELHRRNLQVNHKKVLSIMQAEKLLCKRVKHRKINTTDSEHNNRIYPNLIKKLVPTRPDQVWQADLTYIRLNGGFVYLAAILDGFSRKVVGHALGLFLDASLPLEALQEAIQERKPMSGLIHHSDRGFSTRVMRTSRCLRILERRLACHAKEIHMTMRKWSRLWRR